MAESRSNRKKFRSRYFFSKSANPANLLEMSRLAGF